MNLVNTLLSLSLTFTCFASNVVLADVVSAQPDASQVASPDLSDITEELLRLQSRKEGLITQHGQCMAGVEASDAFVAVLQQGAQAEDELQALDDRMQNEESTEVSDEEYVLSTEALGDRIERANQLRDTLYEDSPCPLIEAQIKAIGDQETILLAMREHRLAPARIQNEIQETIRRHLRYNID